MATQQRSNRQWIIWRDDPKFTDPQTGYISETLFRAAVENELAAWENTLYRLGRGLEVAPIRQEVEQGRFETTGVLFRDVFVPAVKTDQPAPEVEADPLPDMSEFSAPEEETEPQAA